MLSEEEWPPIFAELHRVLAPDRRAYVFCDSRTKPIFDAAAEAAGFRVRAPLIWDKCSIGLGGAWRRAQYELIRWYEKSRPLLPEGRSFANVRRYPRVRGYPAEKPVPLLRELIVQSSSPGWRVLDSFAGSGNVGRAALRLGRRRVLCVVSTEAAQSRIRIRAFCNDNARLAHFLIGADAGVWVCGAGGACREYGA